MDADPSADRSELADVLAACDDALARGDRRSSADALFAANADDRGRLGKKLDCVRLLRQALPRRGPADGATFPLSGLSRLVRGEVAIDAPPPENVGRFQVRRELGRGAFGVVYLAFDPKLGRDVALKTPRFDPLRTPALLERFQTEARAAAGLDHPNIVQVFDAGEADGTFYIASAFCPGVGLDEWLRRRRDPVAVDWAVELVAALADAVGHAHARGVLHRDLKPANILLVDPGAMPGDGPVSASDTVWDAPPCPRITDFGLAKLDPLLGADDATTNKDASWEQLYQTRSGAVVGTPAYMAPEQAGGAAHEVGPAADVYALGVVLYELLTGRPPFVGQSVFDTLHAVRTVDPAPPSRLRAKLPRDVETICLKCLEKSPRNRYPSAQALADDLRRARRLQPIQARPVSTTEHVVRWCRRNPQAAGLTAALVWVAFLGLAGVFWQWRRAEVEAVVARDGEMAARGARTAALAARDRADAERRRAREAVEKMTAAGLELYKQQGQQEAGRKILEQAAAFHEGFVSGRSDDPEAMAAACDAWGQLAWIREELGQRAASVVAHRRAVEISDRLLDGAGDDEGNLTRRARCGRQLARSLYLADRNDEASAAYEAAEAIWRRLCGLAPDDDDRRLGLANSLLNHAVVLQERDRDAAERMYLEALGLQQVNAAKAPHDPVSRREVALTTEALAILAWSRGDRKRGEELFADAEAALGQMEAESPRNEACRWYAARCRLYLGMRLLDLGRVREAGPLVRRSWAALAALRRDFPRSLLYLETTVIAAAEIGRVHEAAGDRAAAETAYRDGIRVYRKLQDASAERAWPVYGAALRLHGTLSLLLLADGRLVDAGAALPSLPSAGARRR